MAYLFYTDRKPTPVWKQLGIFQTPFIHGVELAELKYSTVEAFSKGLRAAADDGATYWLTVGKGEGGEGGPDHDRWISLEDALDDTFCFEDTDKADAEMWCRALLNQRQPLPDAVAGTLARIDEWLANHQESAEQMGCKQEETDAYRTAVLDGVRRAHAAFVERQPEHPDTQRIGNFLQRFKR